MANLRANTAQPESVWDYPRPPDLEQTSEHLRVIHLGVEIADTLRGWRVLETSHPPVYYFPLEDVRTDLLKPEERRSFCEFKGLAQYWTLELPSVDGDTAAVMREVAWSYPKPTAAFAAIRHCLAFYASKVDACWVGEDQVQAQAGDFYGGWITPKVVGPFKGGPGTRGW